MKEAALDSGAGPRKFRPDIEGMRGLAVLWAVCFHADIGRLSGGYVGPEAFFVISGFLITNQITSSFQRLGARGLPNFYARRVRRLLPAAATVVLATVIAGRIWAPKLQVRSISLDGLFTTFYGFNYRLASEGTQYLHATDTVSPLQHFWTLSVEEQFYLLWPVLVLLVAFIGGTVFRKRLLFCVVAVVAIASFITCVHLTHVSGPYAYFSLQSRAWELAVGAMVALGANRLVRIPQRLAAIGGWVALAAILGCVFGYSKDTVYPGAWAAVPVLATALLLSCGCARPQPVEVILSRGFMQRLGRWSYSWYLWHWPMLIIGPFALGHAFNGWERLAVVFISLGFAAATYQFIENPLRTMELPNLRWMANGLAISGTVALAATLLVVFQPDVVGKGAVAAAVVPPAATAQALHAMDEELYDAQALEQAPSNLSPSPLQATKDLPSAASNGCLADYTVVDQPACADGDLNGTKTVVLFGDSHMLNWSPAFIAAGKLDHWKVVTWTKAGCSISDSQVYSPVAKREYTECYDWRAKTIARIKALHPRLVVISQAESQVPADVSPTEYAQQIATTAKTLSVPGTTVVYLEDTPFAGHNVASCVADHINAVRQCGFPVAKSYYYPQRHAGVPTALKQLGVKSINTFNWVCGPSWCPAIVGNILIYRDPSHFTNHFSEWLMPRVEPLLRGGIPRQTSTVAAALPSSTTPNVVQNAPNPKPPAPPTPSLTTVPVAAPSVSACVPTGAVCL